MVGCLGVLLCLFVHYLYHSQLLEASKAGDLELVKKIVNLHPHIVNCRDLDGEQKELTVVRSEGE